MTNILVIGAGVTGMTTALTLVKAGHSVSVVTKDMPENTVSAVAAAHWGPFLCKPLHKVIEWSGFTKNYFETHILSDTTSGVVSQKMVEYFDNPDEEPWWRAAVNDGRKLDSNELPDGYQSGFEIDSLLIDTSMYLPWLKSQLDHKQVAIKQKEIYSFNEFGNTYDLIVNCTGLGAQKLCNDVRLFPVRGQVIKVSKTKHRDVITDDIAHNALSYVIPRINDTVLGGTAQENDWDLSVRSKDTAEILQKTSRLLPESASAKIISEHVGLRPARDEIRLEFENIDGVKVIHNYGHGGAGYTLSWGCAEEVKDLIKRI